MRLWVRAGSFQRSPSPKRCFIHTGVATSSCGCHLHSGAEGCSVSACGTRLCGAQRRGSGARHLASPTRLLWRQPIAFASHASTASFLAEGCGQRCRRGTAASPGIWWWLSGQLPLPWWRSRGRFRSCDQHGSSSSRGGRGQCGGCRFRGALAAKGLPTGDCWSIVSVSMGEDHAFAASSAPCCNRQLHPSLQHHATAAGKAFQAHREDFASARLFWPTPPPPIARGRLAPYRRGDWQSAFNASAAGSGAGGPHASPSASVVANTSSSVCGPLAFSASCSACATAIAVGLALGCHDGGHCLATSAAGLFAKSRTSGRGGHNASKIAERKRQSARDFGRTRGFQPCRGRIRSRCGLCCGGRGPQRRRQ